MKKTLKTAISLFLALIMAFSSLSAFAAEENTTLKWNYYDDIYEYTYAGELTEDTVTLDTEETYIYYTFNCENPGFYSFIYSDENSVWVGIPEKVEDGIAYNEANNISMYPESEYIVIHYIPEGESIIGLDIIETGENNELKIEYLGETLTSIDVKDELIFGDKLEFYADDEGGFLAYMNADYEMVFSNGKTFSNNYIEFTFDEEPVNGENSLEIEIIGQKSVLNVTGYYPDYFIKDITVSNPEKFAYVVQYYDSLDFIDSDGENITVTLSDGTTQSFVYGSDSHTVTLPNGIECDVWGRFNWASENEIIFEMVVGNTVLKTFPCKLIEATLAENAEKMLENSALNLDNTSYYLRQSLIALLECDSWEELANYGASEAGYCLGAAIRNFFAIFTNVFELISFYSF